MSFHFQVVCNLVVHDVILLYDHVFVRAPLGMTAC